LFLYFNIVYVIGYIDTENRVEATFREEEKYQNTDIEVISFVRYSVRDKDRKSLSIYAGKHVEDRIEFFK